MKKIKIGVFGAGRGVDLVNNFDLLGCEVVALCDFNKDRLEWGARRLKRELALYESFDEFIEHKGMDAVIVANYFNEHAPYIIKCFERNIHVFSECISNGTMAEGVELARAYEKTKSIFMLAENYPQMKFNREIKRIVETGTLGKILYAEGEYNHPVNPDDISFMHRYNYFEKHWRNYNARSYYVTHSLGPLMWATGATPRRVTCFAAFGATDAPIPTASYVGDRAALIMMQNDDGSVFRITGCAAFGAHHLSYRVCGTKGQVENLRGMGSKVMLRHNTWNMPDGLGEDLLYEPDWNDKDAPKAANAGHGGGDYFTSRSFVNAILEGKQPEHPFDLYSATVMSSVAILAHRSMLEGGMPYDIPDFRREEDRKKWENDRKTVFYGPNGEAPDLPCCSHPDFKPTDEQLRLYREALSGFLKK